MGGILLYTFANPSNEICTAIYNEFLPSIPIFLFTGKTYAEFEVELNKLHAEIRENEYSYVLGIGQYSGRDTESIRVEQFAKNKFRNHIIGDVAKLILPSFIKTLSNFSSENIKLSSAMGNSWCNLSAYTLSKTFANTIFLDFLHVPKDLNSKLAVGVINKIIALWYQKK